MAVIVMTAHPGVRPARGGYRVKLHPAKPAPKRLVEVKRTAEIAGHVLSFGEAVRAANPGASFMVSVWVAEGNRKPAGFDAAKKADGFGGRAFLLPEGEIPEDEAYRHLNQPEA